MSTPDRRTWPRVVLDAAAIIHVDSLDGPAITSRILNASRNGVLLALPAPRPLGTRIHITVRIDDPTYEITVFGIVAHVHESDSSDPGARARLGIYLAHPGPDWEALCRRLTRTLSSDRNPAVG